MATQLTVLGRLMGLERHLGRGATGDVWLARADDGSAWVLKFARDRAAYARLAEEANRLLGVDSPWCVRLLGAGTLASDLEVDRELNCARLARGTPYLVLEHHEGTTLDQARPTTDDADRWLLALARDVGRALADLHAARVAHGDVKPENVLVESRDGVTRARLVDFGLAGASQEVEARGGTRRYLAPETFDAGPTGDARLRDLYALGVTLLDGVSPVGQRQESPEVVLNSLALAPETKSLIAALLSRAPAARPSADWVAARAFDLLGTEEPEQERSQRFRGLLRRTYLGLRRAELLSAARHPNSQVLVQGPAGQWLSEALTLWRSVEELRGSLGSGELLTLTDLDAVGRARWLVELAGPQAAAWPEVSVSSDGELSERLLRAAATIDPRRLSFADLESAPGTSRAADLCDPIELALLLGRGSCSGAVLDAAERALRPGFSLSLALSLSRSLRLRGQLGRALAVLEGIPAVEARIEAAEVWRRAGDPEKARALLQELSSAELNSELLARRAAILARLALDAADPQGALDLLKDSARILPVLEVQALAEVRLCHRKEAEAILSFAMVVAETEEERARVEAVAGYLAHFDGDMSKALVRFNRAAEHAARAGALLEEASYLTGLSAAAAHVGELGLSRSSARRAFLLFESLGRGRDAARAELALASACGALGARIEAREHALSASQRAKSAGDRRCRAYSHLVLADILPDDDNEGVEHARFAAKLIEEDPDDRLRVAARLHVRGDEVEVARLDELSQAASTAVDARLEWLTARARLATVSAAPVAPARVLESLLSMVGRDAPCGLRGPAFAAGAELAARTADGEIARRLTMATGEAARELLARAGSELQAQIRLLPWVRLADAGHTSLFSPEQIADVERLVRALGRRDRLRPLLEQVVDALVLWTGVERGLLLLRAPQGKLQPRAGRNLLRADLHGRQLELSHSLAERALALGEPVVAVDAAGDLPAEVHQSVHALKLRSVLAVPLIARGEALGVVYLDDRARRGAFGPKELSWVRLVATLAALAIADARDQILLRRAARRAGRAEAKLGLKLARREAELDVAERELAFTRDARDTRYPYDEIVGRSEAMRSMLRLVDRVSASEVPVLLIGDSGSGKELVARAIHHHGPRASQAFVAENCGAIPEPLLESTLFGHVRGAFTGAQRPRAGLFEIAHRGTLFLDEIGEMSLGMQAKLLRALQDGEIRPVGSERSRNVDVRVIGATNRDLTAMVAGGKFREDLYYRLNVITLRIPNLRERIGDVPLLVKHFMGLHGGERRVTVSKGALDMLSAYAWPGNVRQLENEVRRALVLADDVITPEHLSTDITARGEARAVDELNLRQRLDALEVELVRVALRRTDGNQTRAAELLGLSRFGLQKMMKRLEISFESGQA